MTDCTRRPGCSEIGTDGIFTSTKGCTAFALRDRVAHAGGEEERRHVAGELDVDVGWNGACGRRNQHRGARRGALRVDERYGAAAARDTRERQRVRRRVVVAETPGTTDTTLIGRCETPYACVFSVVPGTMPMCERSSWNGTGVAAGSGACVKTSGDGDADACGDGDAAAARTECGAPFDKLRGTMGLATALALTVTPTKAVTAKTFNAMLSRTRRSLPALPSRHSPGKRLIVVPFGRRKRHFVPRSPSLFRILLSTVNSVSTPLKPAVAI